MIFWVLAAILTALVVAALLRPLLRPPHAVTDRRSADMQVYTDQLAEIDGDRARGLLTDAEAEAARTEIARRLLAADRAGGGQAAGTAAGRPGRTSRTLAAAVGLAVPVAALALYLDAGSPGLPSLPFHERDPAERAAQADAEAEARALARVLEVERPDDVEGWVELGRRWAAIGRWESAAAAYGRAVGLTEGDPGLTSAYGEALVNANSGIVTEEALVAFERAVAGLPDDPRARFYLALAESQAGNDAEALAGWQALLADSPPDAPWMPVLRARIGTTAERLGLDPDAATADAGSGPAAAPPAAAPRGPTADQVEQAAEMTPEDRQAMIRSMVAGLAARLEANPEDVDGWMRLGRSHLVLDEPEAALAAYRRAAAQAPGDPDVLRSLADALLATADNPGDPGAEFEDVMTRLYAADPQDMRALWYQGLEARRAGDAEEAAEHWRALLAQLPPDSDEHAIVREQLDALEAGESPPAPDLPAGPAPQPSGG